jgi:hypothetical protein
MKWLMRKRWPYKLRNSKLRSQRAAADGARECSAQRCDGGQKAPERGT